MYGWIVDHTISGVLKWFAKTVVGVLEVLWELLSATVFVSPDVTQLPQVTAFASTSLGIVNSCYVLAFLWMAVLVVGRDTIQAQYGPGELIPRLIIGLIGANFAVPLCSTVIALANALTAAITSQDITAPGSMQQLHAATVTAVEGQTGANAASFLLLLIALLIAVLANILIVQWIIRLGVLVVAVGLSPIALALHGTPQTEAAAKLWWRLLLGTLGTVVIQAVALHTTLTIFLNPDNNLPVLGLPVHGGDPGAVMNLLIVVCLLWGVVKIPGLMSRYITQTRPNPLGMILRVVLIQQITQGLSRGLGRGRHTGRAAARRRSRPDAGGTTVDPPWPVRSGGPSSHAVSPPAISRTARLAGATPRPRGAVTRPAGAGRGRAGVTFPSGRPARPYTRDEIAAGVDLYTRAVKSRSGTSSREAP
ncbi:hypothetical protein [Micromonospora sp. WMMD1082]|uniref:hypothetical protein n=1 Tax=Micromonospora sp. WMMD1082 TaxID=3016104 RepID=UPI002416A80E|nr:hypothetical protein [Micromonospora sp. WMMD1082]MDG4795383.1 hypothetical protein [Micromonospora sp. WMMD1082]